MCFTGQEMVGSYRKIFIIEIFEISILLIFIKSGMFPPIDARTQTILPMLQYSDAQALYFLRSVTLHLNIIFIITLIAPM